MIKLFIPNNAIGMLLVLFGALMIIFAVTVSDETYARALLTDLSRDLSWGPMLFRLLLILHGGLLIGIVLRQRWRAGVLADQGDSRREVESDSGLTPKIVGTLVLLSVFALVIRLWNLNSDLWIDEVLTLLDFVRKPIGEIVTSFPSQNQHMLFSILGHASSSLFGESAWSLRLPSVVFGIASIWALFLLCRNLIGVTESLLASVLMTVSYHHIWFSQNARGYMGLLLFTLLATWSWLRGLETNEWKWWLTYCAAVVLGMWVHPTMAFVVAAHGLVHIVLMLFPTLSGDGPVSVSLEWRARWRPFAAWLLSITITLQLYALSLPEFIAVGLHEESKNSEWTNPLWVVTESIKGLSIGFAGLTAVALGAAFVAFGWFCLFKANRRAAVIMVLPALLAGGTMLMLGHNLWPRFFFFSMGFGLLIVVYGAFELPIAASRYFKPLAAMPRTAAYAGIGFSVLMIAASITTLPRNYALPKQDYSGAKAYVESHLSPGDRIVAVNLAGIVYGGYLTPNWPVARTLSDMEPLQRANDSVWLVYTLSPEIKAFRPELWELIERDYQVVQVFPGTLNGGEIYVCRRKVN